jgi:hypothetical protein
MHHISHLVYITHNDGLPSDGLQRQDDNQIMAIIIGWLIAGVQCGMSDGDLVRNMVVGEEDAHKMHNNGSWHQRCTETITHGRSVGRLVVA